MRETILMLVNLVLDKTMEYKEVKMEIIKEMSDIIAKKANQLQYFCDNGPKIEFSIFI
jgi:hypothetical protein